MATKRDKVVATLVAAATTPKTKQQDYATGHIARVVGVSQDTVSRLLQKYTPLMQSALATYQRDHLLASWQMVDLKAFEHFNELADYPATSLQDRRLIASAMRDMAVTKGIATERAMDVSGQPNRPSEVISEQRLNLTFIASRLLRLASSETSSDASPADIAETKSARELSA